MLGADIGVTLGSTLKLVTDMLDLPEIPIIVCMDSKSVYDCMVKLGTTNEKRLMIDVMGLRDAHEAREISEFRWVIGTDNNAADAMPQGTKVNAALTSLVETDKLTVRCEGWVKRPVKTADVMKMEADGIGSADMKATGSTDKWMAGLID